MKLEEMVGKMMTEAQFDEAAGEKDACYRKVKARYDVWPSAYASGALVKCRKVGAKNWGNKSKKEGVDEKAFSSSIIAKAIKVAKSMGGNMTAAVKKIEKMEKGLSKNGRVEFALQKANESVNEETINEAPEQQMASQLNKVSDTILKITDKFKGKADVDGMTRSWMMGLHARLKKAGIKT